MGQLVIISPPNSQICTPFEAALGVMALKIDKEMAEKSKEEKEILIKHYDILNNIAEYSGTGYGIGMTYLTQHKTHVEEILKEIEKTYVDTYNKHHHLHSKAFLARRKTLFMKLNSALDRMVGRKPMGLDFEVNDIKRSLGLNSKSIIKQWKEQVHPVKGIAGFEENFGKVTSYSKALRYGGYVGIALDVGQSAIKIHEACTVGREQECTKSKFSEGGRVVGSVAGGSLVGMGTSYLVCNVVFGLESAGTSLLWCGILAGGTGGYFGSKYTSQISQHEGEALYENIYHSN